MRRVSSSEGKEMQHVSVQEGCVCAAWGFLFFLIVFQRHPQDGDTPLQTHARSAERFQYLRQSLR